MTATATIDLQTYELKGDKKHSDFLYEYLPKIYQRRTQSGVDEMLTTVRAVMIQVEHGDAFNYMAELNIMGPFRFHEAYINATHRIFILRAQERCPDIILLEPITTDYHDEWTSIDEQFPRACDKPNARYLGEIFHTHNLKELRSTLESHQIRFQDDATNVFLNNPNFAFTQISHFTNNILGYTSSELASYEDLALGEPYHLASEQNYRLSLGDTIQKKLGIYALTTGLDHLATRILMPERESAILEFLCMSNYYFWGAYNIDSQNSSTNVTRNPYIESELHSPAKVFTANNTPFFVNSMHPDLPSPTENFVRNFGKRMHHIAYEVIDGEVENGIKHIDYVVSQLSAEKIGFLDYVVGECKDFPDLKQIFSKHSDYSLLITEYVQRCHNFEGFFTKSNVATLTQAAGADETR